MKTMTVHEFDRFLSNLAIERVVYLSDNQPGDDVGFPLHLHLSFPIIRTALNPNAILLKDGANTMCFNSVRHVELERDGERSLIGWVVRVICKNYADDGKDAVFTIVIKTRP